MKTILRRKDKTSIYIPSPSKDHVSFARKTKIIELVIGCTLIVVGLLVMMMTS